MKLKHVVLTSVNRDDLPDGGARHWSDTVRAVRKRNTSVTVECLIPDFLGNTRALDTVLETAPDVLNHNIETVPRLYPAVRPEADYRASLQVLHRAAGRCCLTAKSGLMVGMGETEKEVQDSLLDLAEHGCSMVTIGQYLQPTSAHLPVVRYVTPYEFAGYEKFARSVGFRHIQSGPFVRSSYHAEDAAQETQPSSTKP
jgi:lipoic acid synthetase